MFKRLRTLKKDVATLEKNKQLQEDLDEARETTESLSQPKKGSRGGPTVKQLLAKVETLRAQVSSLEEVCYLLLAIAANLSAVAV